MIPSAQTNGSGGGGRCISLHSSSLRGRHVIPPSLSPAVGNPPPPLHDNRDDEILVVAREGRERGGKKVSLTFVRRMEKHITTRPLDGENKDEEAIPNSSAIPKKVTILKSRRQGYYVKAKFGSERDG